MILITGANGLLGSFLSNHLTNLSYKVIGLIREGSDLSLLKMNANLELIEGDILDISSLITVFEKYPIEKVIHAAAIVSFHSKDREQMRKVNVDGTRNIINVSLQYSIKKFLHISSVAALGRASSGMVTEKATWVNSPYNSEYGLTKHLAELEVWRAQIEGLKTLIVNPSFILSSADGNRSSSRLLAFIEKESMFYPTGTMNYIDVRDVVKIIVELLEKDIDNERFILNAGSISYQEFFEKAASIAGLKAPKISVKKKLGILALLGENIRSKLLNREPMLTSETLRTSRSKVVFDNSKITDLLNYKFLPLTESLNWIWDQYISRPKVEK